MTPSPRFYSYFTFLVFFFWVIANANSKPSLELPLESNTEASESVILNIPPTLITTGNQSYCAGGSVPVVETISITDVDDTTTSAVYIQISSNYVNGEDLLTLTGTHPNITSSWDAVQGEITLSGPALYSEFETAVLAVEYSSSGNASGIKQFSITVGEANYLPSTQHYYEYVADLGITWTDANAAANSKTYFGLQGYLATLTSQDEANFSGSQAPGTGWIGASDAATEGVWQWVTGPEAGTVFWNGAVSGSTPNFAFWNSGEPNQAGNEDYAHITHPNVNSNGSWNDLSNTGAGSGNYQPLGYVVEYGGMPSDPVLNISGSTQITVSNYDFYDCALDVTRLINSCSADAEFTTVGATPDLNSANAWNNSGPKFNRWFKFIAPATGEINITVDINDVKGNQRHTQLALWQADGITEIKSERYQDSFDDVIMGAVGLTSGTTYYISVDTYNTSTDGTFTLCLSDQVDYDFYEGAEDVTALINSCSADAQFTTIGATPDKNSGNAWNNSGPKYNRWFKFTAPATGQINITVDINDAKGNQRYTQLALWEADGTTEVVSERYQTTLEDVIMGAVGLTAGAAYYISIDTYNSNTDGTFTLCLEDAVDYDFFDKAEDVTSLINSCSADAAYTTIGATPDLNAASAWNNSGPKHNRWFMFTAPATGQINITVDVNDAKGNQRATQLALWQADGVTEIKSERYSNTYDDVIMGAIGLTPGSTYYISVDTYNSSYDGTFTLCLADQVDYDFYEGAEDVTSLINSCSADAQFSTIGATPDLNGGSAWNNSGPKFNRWFKFIAPTTGEINITVDVNDAKGNQRHTQLALWQADGITEIKSERYQNSYDDVIMGAVGLTAGTTYYISVDTYNTSTDGAFTLCLENQVDYDFYEGAEDVTPLINSCSADAKYTTIGATPDLNSGSAWNNSGPKHNRWFKFIAPATGQINITVDINDVKGNQRYTQLALWEVDGTTEVVSERYQTTLEDVITGAVGLTVGATYYISVDTYNSNTDGTFTLCLEDEVDYDFFDKAEDVTPLINSCSVDAAYTTVGATPDLNAGSAWNNSGPKHNRWFKFIAPATSEINITVDVNDAKGNQRNTQLALWEADGITEIVSERYQNSYDDVIMGAVGLTAGNTYYISVDTYNSSYDGTFTLCLSDQVDYDFYEGAEDVTSLMNSCSADAQYTTIGATPDLNAGSTWNNSGPKHNRWFKFIAPASGQINATVDVNGVKGNQRYGQIALWEADGQTEITSRRYISTTDDVILEAVGLTAGATYYLSVDTYNSNTDGTFTLCLKDQVGYDFYEGAEDVTSLINSCSLDAIYTTIGATPDLNAASSWNNNGPKFNRWFKFIAPATGEINITVDATDAKGSQRYTQLALWQADGLAEIKSERYQYSTEDVDLGALGLTPGATYYISVDTYNTSTDGTFTLCLEDQVDYDFYEGAKDVTGLINACSLDAEYTTIGATPDLNGGSAWNNNGPKVNRWFKFIAPATGQINVTVDIEGVKGSQRRTQVAFWEADGITEVASERYQYNLEDVIMGAVGLTSGATYYISIDAYSTGYDGTFTLCLEDQVDYDFYDKAEDVTSLINSCSVDAAYATIGATPDLNAGSAWNNNGPKVNRWFKFIAPATGQINITVDIGGVKGSQSRTELALWEADGITEITSERYQFNAEDVIMGAVGLTPGVTYYISIDTYNTGSDGSFTLCLQDAVDYDFYEGAEEVTSLINSCSADAVYSTVGATPDLSAGSVWNNNGPKMNRWFRFTASATGQISITVDVNDVKGNQRYSQIALWEVDGLTEITSRRYISSTEDVVLEAVGLTAGATYYISVDSYNTNTDGSFTLCLSDQVGYDFYEGAEEVTALINSCSADAIYTTIRATPDLNAGSSWNNNGPKYNRWFKFIAPTSGQINITIDATDAKGSQRYTQLALWEADGITEIKSERYQFSTEDVDLGAMGLTSGATYYISVDTYNSGTDGTFTLCLEDQVDYDYYEGAEDVTALLNSCSADGQYTTIGATPDLNAGSAWNNSGPRFNRWFKFVASAGSIEILVDIGSAKGTQSRTQLAVWEVDGTTELFSARYSGSGDDVTINASGLVLGNTYYISVDSYNTNTDGSFTLCLNAVESDLSIVNTVDVTNSCVGDTVTFTMVLTNNGPSAVASSSTIEVTNSLPVGLSYVSDTGYGTYNPISGIWRIPTIDASGVNSIRTKTITALVTTSGTLIDTAQITYTPNIDSNTSNNTDTAALTGLAASSITLQPVDQTVSPGATASFMVTTLIADSYQWQLSTDNGITFNALSDGVAYSGTQSATLTVLSTMTNQNGNLFRVLIANSGTPSCPVVNSEEAELLVQRRTLITNRRTTYRVRKN